jgi:hypothetical protein
MSKFDEMCKAFADARKSWFEYRDRSFANMAMLATGFINYCGFPQENVGYGTPDKNDLRDKKPLPFAMEFNSTDGYWHVDVYITVFEAPNIYPYHVLRFRLCLRESGGKLLVKRGWDDKPREIDLKDKSQCDDFYAGVVERVKEIFGRRPQDLAEDQSKSRTLIGFNLDALS